MPYVLLLFIAMPIIEIAVLLKVGDAIGWLTTLAVVILTAILGTAMLRQQGLATLNTARQRLNAGEMPAEQMLEGVMLLIGGVLLLTPGFVTDAFGFLCLVPPSRRWLAGRIQARSAISMGGFTGQTRAHTPSSAGSTPVGSGATEGARQASDSPASILDAGGKPRRDAVNSPSQSPGGQSGSEIIDADFRSVDD